VHQRSGQDPEPPHDILAAEEFPLGAGDPALHAEPPHDILAAEEFPLGSGDPALRHGPIVLPEDLTGSPEPRDVLVAEEFPMPAPVEHATPGGGAFPGTVAAPSGQAGRGRGVHSVLIAAAGIALLLAARRRRRAR
jgi:hypothetical protein